MKQKPAIPEEAERRMASEGNRLLKGGKESMRTFRMAAPMPIEKASAGRPVAAADAYNNLGYHPSDKAGQYNEAIQTP